VHAYDLPAPSPVTVIGADAPALARVTPPFEDLQVAV
jgi:hypothetical protein